VKSKTRYFANLYFISLTAYFFIPIIWLLLASTKSFGELEDTHWFEFGSKFALFENILSLLMNSELPYGLWFKNSLIYTFTTSFIALICSALAGYGLAAFKFKGKTFIRNVVAFLAMVPPSTLAFPLYLSFSKVNIINTPWSVIFPGTAFPTGMFLVYVYLLGQLNFEIVEAARIDRAGEFLIFWKIIWPASKPVVAIVFLISFVQNWNSYLLPLLVLSETKYYPLPLGLSTSYGGPMLVIGTLVAMLPVLFVFLSLQGFVDRNRMRLD
jgi:multiple sugar transport system permease protein